MRKRLPPKPSAPPKGFMYFFFGNRTLLVKNEFIRVWCMINMQMPITQQQFEFWQQERSRLNV